MESTAKEIRFDSGTGWAVGQFTFRPQYGISLEALFEGDRNETLYLELRGIRSPDQLLGMLNGFDDFQILARETGTRYPAAAQFLFRFFIDDDSYETVVDEYEAYTTTGTEQGAPPNP
jgi:hypothetical protein